MNRKVVKKMVEVVKIKSSFSLLLPITKAAFGKKRVAIERSMAKKVGVPSRDVKASIASKAAVDTASGEWQEEYFIEMLASNKVSFTVTTTTTVNTLSKRKALKQAKGTGSLMAALAKIKKGTLKVAGIPVPKQAAPTPQVKKSVALKGVKVYQRSPATATATSRTAIRRNHFKKRTGSAKTDKTLKRQHAALQKKHSSLVKQLRVAKKVAKKVACSESRPCSEKMAKRVAKQASAKKGGSKKPPAKPRSNFFRRVIKILSMVPAKKTKSVSREYSAMIAELRKEYPVGVNKYLLDKFNAAVRSGKSVLHFSGPLASKKVVMLEYKAFGLSRRPRIIRRLTAPQYLYKLQLKAVAQIAT